MKAEGSIRKCSQSLENFIDDVNIPNILSLVKTSLPAFMHTYICCLIYESSSIYVNEPMYILRLYSLPTPTLFFMCCIEKVKEKYLERRGWI